jgi:hypothetical protein
LKGQETAFASKFIKIDQADAVSRIGGKPELIIEKLIPEKGNTLFHSSPEATVEFLVNENPCRCSIKNIGVSNTYPYFGFIVSFPEAVEISERRREDRRGMPKFVSVEFNLKSGPEKEDVYDLEVANSSMHGLGLLVTKKDLGLIENLNVGDRLDNMTFYATSAMIRVDCTVRHITQISQGNYMGCYIVGIQSDEIIEGWKQKST